MGPMEIRHIFRSQRGVPINPVGFFGPVLHRMALRRASHTRRVGFRFVSVYCYCLRVVFRNRAENTLILSLSWSNNNKSQQLAFRSMLIDAIYISVNLVNFDMSARESEPKTQTPDNEMNAICSSFLGESSFQFLIARRFFFLHSVLTGLSKSLPLTSLLPDCLRPNSSPFRY